MKLTIRCGNRDGRSYAWSDSDKIPIRVCLPYENDNDILELVNEITRMEVAMFAMFGSGMVAFDVGYEMDAEVPDEIRDTAKLHCPEFERKAIITPPVESRAIDSMDDVPYDPPPDRSWLSVVVLAVIGLLATFLYAVEYHIRTK